MGTVYNTNVVTDGLMGCWDAGNRKSWYGNAPVTADFWHDLAGGYPAVIANAGGSPLTFDPANLGAIAFDGTDDYVGIGNFDNISPVSGTNSFTFGIWIYLNNTDAITFMSQRVDSNNRWSWWWNASSNMYFSVWTSGSDTGTGALNYNFETDRWYYLTLVRDSNTVLFYIDSVLKYSTSYTHSITAKEAGLFWGYDQQNYNSLNGKIAFVHVYPKALSAAEVKQNYNALKSRFAEGD